MKSNILFSVFLILFLNSFGQKFLKPYIGINFTKRILVSDYENRKDSLDNADKVGFMPNAGVLFLYEKKPGREFFWGIAYNQIGFERERLNYKFQDTVHPDLGQIHDLSQAAQKNGYFTYHFNYLEFPIGYNFQVTPREQMHNFTGWFNIGITPQFLINQNMAIFLQGFTMKGENKFKFKNTGYNAAKMNLTLQSGGRVDVNVRSKFWVTSDFLFKINMMNAAENTLEKLRFWYVCFNLGLRYEIGDFR
ncbi:MAG: hypothetical protein HUU47_06755 [Bacteroidetes bacterium]|nr:hypothetical protein [Bacteroidota bacterium]